MRDLLLNDPRELNGLLLAAKKQDLETGSSTYEQLKYTLVTIEPSFESQIQRFEQNYNPALTLEKAYITALSGSDIHIEGSSVISYSEDGGIIAIDTSKRPPFRSIGLTDSEYLIDSNYPVAELHKPHTEYLEIRNRLVPQIESANILKTESVQGHIEDMVEHGFSLGEVKVQLARCYRVDVSYLQTLDDLKPESLEQFAAEMIKALDRALVETQQELHKKTLIQKEKVQEADKAKREILRFINSIGFDLIDQPHTDTLIDEIQSNSLHVEGLNLDPTRLDI